MAFFVFAESLPLPPEKLKTIFKMGFASPGWEKDAANCKTTRLTHYLKYGTWTPEIGAYLINGIVPSTVGKTDLVGKVAKLSDGKLISPVHLMPKVQIILTLWNTQLNPPEKVTPVDFIKWCESKNIGTGWVTNSDEWEVYAAAHKRQTEILTNNVAVIKNGKRNVIKKYYYRLNEVTEILGCKLDDLIHLAANGKLIISKIRLGNKFSSEIALVPTDRQTWITIERNESDLFFGKEAEEILMNLDEPKRQRILDSYKKIEGVTVLDELGIAMVREGDFLKNQLPINDYVITHEELKKLQIDNVQESQGDQQAEALADDVAKSKDNTTIKNRELKTWLQETWIKEGKPGGTDFFKALKKYVHQCGSPVTQHHTAGADAGIAWKTSSGTTGELKKKSILTMVSTFKKTK